MKHKFKIEYLLYVFIIISPFLDAMGFLYRETFKNASISPATIIRLIIPLILLLYVFITDRKMRKSLLLLGLLLVTYGSIHIYLYKNIITGISYGNVFHEAQYIINYTYMLFVLFLYLYFGKQKKLNYLKQSLVIMLVCYLGLIYISIFTHTSYSTYIDGTGYKGWFTSGNSLSTILVILLATLISSLFDKSKIKNFIILFLTGLYLLLLVGTRTGLFGFFLVLGIYFISLIIIKLFKNNKINIKKMIVPLILTVILSSILINIGSSTLERRRKLKEEENQIIDINTDKPSHTTGDTAKFVYQIKNNLMDENYMSIPQKKALVSMYEYANKNNVLASDSRKQQLIYNLYLIKYQKNVLYILFGNGYLANYGEMTLEMEIPALLFNFGIIGFVLYAIPFILILIYSIKTTIKNYRKINIENIMNIFALALALLLSFTAGYVLFSASCILIIIVISTFILKEGE